MWFLKNSVLVVLIVGTFSTIRCKNDKSTRKTLSVQGRTIQNPSKLIHFVLNLNSTLKDEEKCRSMKVISILGLDTLHSNFVADLPHLEVFETYNVFEIEPWAFRNVPNLSKVMVDLAYFKDIKENIFNHLNVVELSLKEGKLETIAPKAFDDMPKLEKLDLSENRLTIWNSEWFRNTPNLKILDLRKNEIEELPREVFKNLIHPEVDINLDWNKIRKIGEKLFSTKKIGRLSLRFNEIESFSDHVLDGVEEMQQLNIARNKIKCFSGDLNRIFVADDTQIWGNNFECDCAKKIVSCELQMYKNDCFNYLTSCR